MGHFDIIPLKSHFDISCSNVEIPLPRNCPARIGGTFLIYQSQLRPGRSENCTGRDADEMLVLMGLNIFPDSYS
jgi:hypothetical protein